MTHLIPSQAPHRIKGNGFWRKTWAVLIKEFIQLRRDRVSFAMIIMVPLIQLMLFGYAINTTPRDLPTAVLLQENSDLARSILAALQNTKYFKVTERPRNEAELDELLASGKVLFAVEVPANFEGSVPRGDKPAIWLLGSSGFSAQLAGILGLPFSFAHHFSPRNTEPALELYRSSFEPSEVLSEPYAMVAVAAICAEDDERARWLSGPARLSMARLRAGMPTRFPTPEEAAEHEFSDSEEASVRSLTGSAVIGSPETARRRFDELKERTRADELMVTTMVHDHADRIRSYELLATEVFGLAPALA